MTLTSLHPLTTVVICERLLESLIIYLSRAPFKSNTPSLDSGGILFSDLSSDKKKKVSLLTINDITCLCEASAQQNVQSSCEKQMNLLVKAVSHTY